MFNLQGSEIIVILLVALVVLGPEKLPDAVRRASRTYHELKKMGTGFQSELKAALDEPMREMRETADLVRDAADPRKLTAESSTSTTAGPGPTDTAIAPAADDEVLGEMWEDEALYPGSSTIGTPPPDTTGDDKLDTAADDEPDTTASDTTGDDEPDTTPPDTTADDNDDTTAPDTEADDERDTTSGISDEDPR